MMRFRVIVSAALGVLLALGATAAYTMPKNADRPRLAITKWAVAAQGDPITVTGSASRMLDQFNGSRIGDIDTVYLLGSRDGRSVYRISTTSGTYCYAAGPAALSVVSALGVIGCAVDPAFPSLSRPLMDFSVLTTAGGSTHYSRVEGVAAEGITAIQLADAAGKTIARVPVFNGVYDYTPDDSSVVTISALDASGNAVPVVQAG